MGLYQILTAPQNFKFYAEKSFPNANAVSTANFFGQKSIGYGDSNQPYIKIPFAGSGQSFSKLNEPSKDFPWFLNEFGNLPLNFISGIAWINLDRSLKRKKYMMNLLKDINIPNYRISAIDGKAYKDINSECWTYF